MTVLLYVISYIVVAFLIAACQFIFFKVKFKLKYPIKRANEEFDVFDNEFEGVMCLVIGSMFWPLFITVAIGYGIGYFLIRYSFKFINRCADSVFTVFLKRKNERERPKIFMEM